MKRVLIVLLGVLVIAPGALASERHPTLGELENEVMCPVCGTTLAQSDSAAAQQIKRVIQQRIASGASKSQIKQLLVSQYGESILASPPARGFNLLAWLLPLVGILGGALILAVLAWHWSRRRPAEQPQMPWALNGRPLEPDLERRLDEELARFD
jgi:cytochrome c-type biogenesis protein CcmH